MIQNNFEQPQFNNEIKVTSKIEKNIEDIKISIGEVELLQIKIRLIIASVDKAQEIGIDWWKEDSSLSSSTRIKQLQDENKQLKEKLSATKIEL